MPLAIVLGGGAARGAFQAGAYAALALAGVRPRFMLGASIGAVNALGAVKLTPSALIQWWLTKLPKVMLARPGAPVPFTAVLAELVALPRREAWPVLAVAERMANRQAHVVTLNQAPNEQLQWLLATTAIPHVYPAVTINGERYSDGAVLDELPIDLARALGATAVIAIEAGGIGGRSKQAADWLIKVPPRAPGLMDFRVRSRAWLVTQGFQAGEKLVKSPAFQAWLAEHA